SIYTMSQKEIPSTSFGDKYIEKIKAISEEDLLKAQKRVEKSIKLIYEVMGKNGFRSFSVGSGKASAVSVLIAFHQILAFDKFAEADIRRNKDLIKESLIKELTQD